MVGLILGITISLALIGVGIKEFKNIRKDIKKIKEDHLVEEVLKPFGDPFPRKRNNKVEQPKKKKIPNKNQ